MEEVRVCGCEHSSVGTAVASPDSSVNSAVVPHAAECHRLTHPTHSPTYSPTQAFQAPRSAVCRSCLSLGQVCDRREVCLTSDSMLCNTAAGPTSKKKKAAYTFFKFNDGQSHLYQYSMIPRTANRRPYLGRFLGEGNRSSLADTRGGTSHEHH